MAKSKALLKAEERIAILQERTEESDRVITQLRDQQAELQRQLNASRETVARWCEKYKRKAKRYEDVKQKTVIFAGNYMDLVLAYAAAGVRSCQVAGAGPFKCAGSVDYDPERIFEYFSEKIPGGDHWRPENRDDPRNTETSGE